MRTSLLIAAVFGAAASVANAESPPVTPPTCASLTNPVYIQCGDTQANLMLNLGRALRDNTVPITLVWVTDPSCTNVNLAYLGGNIGSGSAAASMSYVPSSGVLVIPLSQSCMAMSGRKIEATNGSDRKSVV